MANIITGTQLVMLSQSNVKGKSPFSFEILALSNMHNKTKSILSSITGETSNVVTIFLSHSHSEKVMLQSFLSILFRLGVEVYVDWMDEEMPYPPSGKTAERIKIKINENQKFILLATNRAIASKWCNWELGLGDAAKFDENIALFPVAESNGWNGNEYLQIYPYIEKINSNYLQDSFKVTNPKGGSISLQRWLNK